MKKSKQRDAVLACVNRHHDHPTAVIIYNEVKQDFPNISLGTVYRNLSLLTEMNQIRKVAISDDSIHYDPITHPHSHYVCTVCGRIYDVPDEAEPEISSSLSSSMPGSVDFHTTAFYGRCHECQS